MTIRAGGIGPGGNIALTIKPIKDTEAPFAVMNGTSSLVVSMDLSIDYEAMAIAGRAGTYAVAPALATPPFIDPATGGIGARLVEATPGSPTAAEMTWQAQWDQLLVQRISTLFSEDLQDAIRLGGVNVDETILTFNADGTINTENSIQIDFSSVPAITSPQPATNYLQISATDQLTFTMRTPGDAGNKYKINVETHSNAGILTQWKDDVLTIRLPSGANYSTQDIQDAVDRASAGRTNLEIDVTVQTLLPAPATDPAITANINTPTGVAPNLVYPITDYINGRTLPLGMNGGMDSFFESAFRNLQTVILNGGAFYAEQDVSTVRLEIGRDGVIYGWHPVHEMLILGRIDIVDFINPEGLQQVGTSYFMQTRASGEAQVRIPQEESDTMVLSSALEMSNVDLSQEFSDMIITQRGFQANSRIITVSDTMLEELINLKR
jgi:flagellar hook-basal body protein